MTRSRFKVVRPSRRTLDGITFDSRIEAKRYAELALLVKAGVISALRLQPSFKVDIAGKHFCTYTADFEYVENGQIIVEEIKSSGTAKDAAYRLRRKAAELDHGIKVRELIK
jgi:hypothetical protein